MGWIAVNPSLRESRLLKIRVKNEPNLVFGNPKSRSTNEKTTADRENPMKTTRKNDLAVNQVPEVVGDVEL